MKRAHNALVMGLLIIALFQKACTQPEAPAPEWNAPVEQAKNLKKNIIAAVVMMSLQERMTALISALEKSSHAQDRVLGAQFKQALPDLTQAVPDIEESERGGQLARRFLERFDILSTLVNEGFKSSSAERKGMLLAMKTFFELVKVD